MPPPQQNATGPWDAVAGATGGARQGTRRGLVNHIAAMEALVAGRAAAARVAEMAAEEGDNVITSEALEELVARAMSTGNPCATLCDLDTNGRHRSTCFASLRTGDLDRPDVWPRLRRKLCKLIAANNNNNNGTYGDDSCNVRFADEVNVKRYNNDEPVGSGYHTAAGSRASSDEEEASGFGGDSRSRARPTRSQTSIGSRSDFTRADRALLEAARRLGSGIDTGSNE